MKIYYCLAGLFNSAGMEKIVTEKANYLVENGHEVTIITAEQRNRPIYYKLNEKVRHIDLGINYSENTSIIKKILTYRKKIKNHKTKLSKLLLSEKPDVVITTMGNEFFFLHSLKDGSKKIAEIHFTKKYRLLENRSFPWNLIDLYRTTQENRLASKYDKFVVLTHEDAKNWSSLNNIAVIPNFISIPKHITPYSTKNRLLCVGRLTYQKGYDRLIKACQIIKSDLKDKWIIDIYGSGNLQDEIKSLINEYNLNNIIRIHPPHPNIHNDYSSSDALILTSRYEGFALVLIEAMSYGTPPISFDCPCGPKDIINNYKDGILVKNGDIQSLAKAISSFIKDPELRKRLSANCINRSYDFEKKTIMKEWIQLFET